MSKKKPPPPKKQPNKQITNKQNKYHLQEAKKQDKMRRDVLVDF